jgi:hypothetical protein
MSRDTELEELAKDFDKDPAMQRLYRKIFTKVAAEMGITVGEVRELVGEAGPSAGKGLGHVG